jgi:hypothetical protein
MRVATPRAVRRYRSRIFTEGRKFTPSPVSSGKEAVVKIALHSGRLQHFNF